MQKFISTYIKGDKIIWAIFVIMIIVSAVTMYSASSSLAHKAVAKGGTYYSPVWMHVMFLLGGLAVVFFVHKLPFKYIMMAVRPMYIASLILLVLTPIIGVSVNGARRWISLFGILFQPSELVKVSTVLFLACLLSQYQNKKDKTPDDGLWRYLVCLMVPSVIIMVDNLSTALLLVLIGFMMMYFARLSWKLLLKMIGIGVLGVSLVIGVIWLAPEAETHVSSSEHTVMTQQQASGLLPRLTTWKKRLSRFFEETPEEEKYTLTEENYQERRAKIAVANGKWFGLGIGNSVQRDFLPLAYADFIFSLMIEEVGFLAIFVIILYLAFMYRVGVLIKKQCNSVAQSLIALGLSSMIMVQTYINVFIAVGLAPVSGQPLPLFSRGGTSILITSLYFGIILCISKTAMEQNEEAKMQKARKQAESCDKGN